MRRKLRKLISIEQCLICLSTLDELSELGSLPCNHSQFCFRCIWQWSDTSNQCPLCKSRFSKIHKASKTPSGVIVSPEFITVAYKDMKVESVPNWYLETSCTVCGAFEDEANMLLCDDCDRGFHTHCIGLSGIPHVEEWFCDNCLILKDSEVSSSVWRAMRAVGLEFTPRRPHEFVLVQHETDALFDRVAKSLNFPTNNT